MQIHFNYVLTYKIIFCQKYLPMGDQQSKPLPPPQQQQPSNLQTQSFQRYDGQPMNNSTNNSMGNQVVQQQTVLPNPVYKPLLEESEDIYILQDLSTFSLKGKSKQIFRWVDPKIFNAENQKYENYLKTYIQVDGCSSVEGLMNELSQIDPVQKIKVICAASLKDQQYKILQNEERISIIYLFCQNKERAKLLMNNFPKIKSAKYDIVELKDYLLQQAAVDQGLDPKINVLIAVEQDTHLMNKYRINFHSLTSGKSKHKAKIDFINFARKFYPDNQAEINYFQQTYQVNVGPDKGSSQAIAWLSKASFFWQSTQILPKITTDPKKLAYLRFPFKQSYEGIIYQYKKKLKVISECFLVLIVTPQQMNKLKQNIENFLIFTSFMKAYTNEKKAKIAAKKNSHSVLVRIMMKLPPKIAQNLDFGYITLPPSQNDPDVIFNLYNVFQIIQYEEDLKQFTFQYGSLAQVAYIREKQRGTRLTPFQENLLRNYDYLQDITSRINSQATILQMSGHFQDSLQIHNQKLQIIRKSQPTQEVIDRHTIQLGDAYRLNQQFKKAEEQYLSIRQGKMALIANVHLAQLYFKTKQSQKLQRVISDIEKNLPRYKQISQPDSFKAQNYIGMQLINREKYREASKLYKALARQINDYYDFKFEGIPLVHQINRNRAACEMKLKNYTQALNLLDSTKGWQRVCQGSKSPGLIITENLIKSVHQSRGQTKLVQQCEQQMQKIKKQSPKQQNLYLSRSGVFVNLNQSVINIETTNFNQGPAKMGQNQKPILQQSTFYIDL